TRLQGDWSSDVCSSDLKILEGGKLGKLVALHADVLFAKGRPGTAKLGAPRKEKYPPQRHQLIEAKRELDNVGVYPITLAAWLTGDRKSTRLNSSHLVIS